MRTTTLGWTGVEVSVVGFGAWSLSGAYGPADDARSLETVAAALAAGVTFVDTADAYGNGHNEELVGKAIAGRRDGILLATKVGWVEGPGGRRIDGRPERMQAALEASLARLGVDHVDLWYLHRRDPNVPIEETIGGMAGLVAQGKVRYLGLSEVSAATLRRAHAVHPIAALQSEYSLFTRDPEASVIPAARELEVAFVAFSPLSRGLLSGAVDVGGEGDFRVGFPRFETAALATNLERLGPLERIAAARGATPAQVALAWLVEQGAIPIPGTRSAVRAGENGAAGSLSLTGCEVAELDAAYPPDVAEGPRYPPALATLVDAST